nr:MAG: hypothetical protein DIU78_05175 [Pseudomonadota bacterium]
MPPSSSAPALKSRPSRVGSIPKTTAGKSRPSSRFEVAAISGGFDHYCALSKAGHVKCWGGNEGGEADVPRCSAKTAGLEKLMTLYGTLGEPIYAGPEGLLRCRRTKRETRASLSRAPRGRRKVTRDGSSFAER